MNKFRSQYLKSGAIIVFLFLLYAKGHSQTIDDSNQQDSSKNEMLHEDGKNYVPAYSFYIHSLYPSLVEPVLIDTTVFHPYCEDISLYSRNLYANTGIFGRANYSMNFSFYRKHGFVYKTYPWNDYLRTIENWEMFSLKEVYTRLEYNFANGKENHFSVTHAQQITEDVYFGFGLESIIAQGRYVMQRIRDVNMG
ncbi:MAG: hypothetical protein LBQ64_02735, partial [Bacteroidales bacterium]|nr:hypothetical protein [Bacteroidales bacterium]